MNDTDYNTLPTEIAQALLDRISPGSRPVAMRIADGSYSNYTHLLTALDAQDARFTLVVRRYRVFGDYDRGEKARREFTVLQWACRNGIPAPQPIYLDESGDLLGIPGLVTHYVTGAQVETPVDPFAWARALADTLARMHAVACDPDTRSRLLDANAEAAWFLRSGSLPDFMRDYPEGERVWQALRENYPRLQPVQPGLVHLDYWPGNILWQGDKICAVVDWEEAAYGDPAIDVAYCRMDMILRGLPQAADEFLATYEAAAGHSLANLGFWELAAAARPMDAPQGWVDQSPQKENLATFIEQAERKVE